MHIKSVFKVLLIPTLLLFSNLSEACWGNTTCSGPLEASFPGPWEKNMYSPASRMVSPRRILNANNDFLREYSGATHLVGNGSLLVFDFGQEVGGLVTIKFETVGQGTIGLAFTEAKNFTGFVSDESNGGSGPDGALLIDVSSDEWKQGSYTTPLSKLRGGFRYLSVFTLTNSTAFDVTLDTLKVELDFQPSWPNLRAYGGYFHSSDTLLNRIWYACAYTVQANSIPPDTGRVWPAPSEGWLNDANLGPGDSVLVDGAKRDRAVWAGDLGISIPSALVGLGDLQASKNALNILYLNQEPGTGELPEVGPPINFFGSDAYHMAAMIATHDYVLYSNDITYLETIWPNYTQAMHFITARIDDTGLLNVTGASGWGRSATAAGYSTIGNMLMYGTLKSGSSLAVWLKQPQLSAKWEQMALKLKAAVNSANYNWDSTVGAFKNNPMDSSIFPEDGNSMALFFDGANSSHFIKTSDYLTTNWGPIGARVPECPGSISPYVESYEIKGHLKAGKAQRALDLMRLSWGWYLKNPMGTESSMIEGYNEDGSFLYTANEGYNQDGSYPSHAHGWSTGPVDALVSYVVGIQPTAPGGADWTLYPQTGDLKFAEGGFTTPLGKFSASWHSGPAGLAMQYDVPKGTAGKLQLQLTTSKEKVFVDGHECVMKMFDHNRNLFETNVEGGKHTIHVEE